MDIFINDHPITIIGDKQLQNLHTLPDFDKVIDCRLEILKPENLQGHCLLLNADTSTIDRLWGFILSQEHFDFLGITLHSKDKLAAVEHIKSYYKIIKAAGGVIAKEDKILLIYRLKKWDFPKGKIEKDEKSRACALREVEEECGIKAKLEGKLCTTWHTYTQSGSRILKRTKWYKMTLIDGSKIKPQAEEDIEKIEWMTLREAQKALANSYSSIRYVFEQVKG